VVRGWVVPRVFQLTRRHIYIHWTGITEEKFVEATSRGLLAQDPVSVQLVAFLEKYVCYITCILSVTARPFNQRPYMMNTIYVNFCRAAVLTFLTLVEWWRTSTSQNISLLWQVHQRSWVNRKEGQHIVEYCGSEYNSVLLCCQLWCSFLSNWGNLW
jgi:hypothetical protein